jgi:hypothetical protein
MIELWINQAIHLSPGQAGLLICLALMAVGLAFVMKGIETDV